MLALPTALGKLYDVIALALTPRARSDHQAGSLAVIQSHVDGRAADPDLCPARVAVSFDISVRYLNRLFAGSGTSFAEYVIDQHLARTRRLLADPPSRHQQIFAIACECGLRNINHFGPHFRVRFGRTPGEFRNGSALD